MYTSDYNFTMDPETLQGLEYLRNHPEILFAIVGIFLFFFLAITLVLYFFHSIGLYTLAKNRGLAKPWLAWIPIADQYLLGKISDDIRQQSKKSMNFKIILPVLSGFNSVLTTILLISFCSMFFNILFYALSFDSINPDIFFTSQVPAITTQLSASLLSSAVSIAYLVFWLMALYHIFKAYCTGSTPIVFTVLLVFFKQLLSPFFIFAIRNKQPIIPENQEYHQPETDDQKPTLL